MYIYIYHCMHVYCIFAIAATSNVYCMYMIMCKCTCECIYIYDYVHTYMHACMHAYIHTYIHTYIHIFIHSYIHTYTHTHIYTYTHIHTHTHFWHTGMTNKDSKTGFIWIKMIWLSIILCSWPGVHRITSPITLVMDMFVRTPDIICCTENNAPRGCLWRNIDQFWILSLQGWWTSFYVSSLEQQQCQLMTIFRNAMLLFSSYGILSAICPFWKLYRYTKHPNIQCTYILYLDIYNLRYLYDTMNIDVIYIYYIWVFPKIGLLPNHSF